MTNSYDWIVIGAGITGAALSYELANQGFSVLLLEKDAIPDNATRYSYGGLAYWSGTCRLTRQLSQEGIECHRQLSEELAADTQFRQLDLLLTIARDEEPQQLVNNYAHFAITPRLLDTKTACDLEPLLNPEAIAGALQLPHGHIHPDRTTQAYIKAYQRLGGKLVYAQVLSLLKSGTKITGVKTAQQNYHGANTVVCAGGLSRALLRESGIHMPLYFTHAELIITPPVQERLRTLVMPANNTRFELEAAVSDGKKDYLWDLANHEPVPPVVDPGAIQFLDGSICLGQLSRVLTDPYATINQAESEQAIRHNLSKILPTLANLTGTWHHCLVAFNHNPLPVVGAVNSHKGVYIFSGFTSTLLFAPPLAKHFARWASRQDDSVIKDGTLITD